MVGHAPDNKSDEETEEWWKLLEVPSRYKSWPVFGMLDANAHVGETFSEHIGEHGASHPDNANGRALGEWAQRHQLFLPQTFEASHRGQHWTWEHGTGKRSRIDYIAIPCEMAGMSVMSGQAEDFDVTLSRTDHVAIQAEFQFVPIANKPSQNVVTTPQSDEVTTIDWSTDVHTHAQSLATSWRSFQNHNACEKSCQHRRKAHMSEDTWHLVDFKKKARRRLLNVLKDAGGAFCRHIFATWAKIANKKECALEPPSRQWLRQVDHSIAIAHFQYKRACRAVVQAVRADDANFYNQLAHSTGQVAADEGIGGLWKHIKHLLPRFLGSCNVHVQTYVVLDRTDNSSSHGPLRRFGGG